MKKQLTSLRNTLSAVALLLLVPITTFAALSANNPAVDLLTRVSLFIKTLVIPVLFGIAFLFFLVNMVRYFIIGGANQDSRAKGLRNTLYGLAAFVFLMSIWSIISIFLGGIGIDNSTSICPDYLENCGEGTSGEQNRALGGGTTNFPTSGGVGGSTGAGSRTSNFSGFAELIFGTGKDSALFTNYTGSPRAVYQTPLIANNASCEAGLNTLLLANSVETTQAAYVLYKDNAGQTRWENITDLSSTNQIIYDKDVLNSILQTDVQNIHILHTHQNARIENLDLVMEGHGPSAADMKAMCSNDDTSITYAVVDWNGIWIYKQQSDTCPYSTTASNVLPLIETYGVLASLEASVRESELSGYIRSSVTPTQYKNHFSDLQSQQPSSLTPEALLSLSAQQQTYASTTVLYQKSVSVFCSTF